MAAAIEPDQRHGTILDLLAPRLAMLARVDLPHHPRPARIVEEEPDQVDGVRGVHEETGTRVPICLDRNHVPYLAIDKCLPCGDVLPGESPLVPDQEAGATGAAGLDHVIGRGEVERDRLFAKDRLRRGDLRRFDRHRGVELVMRTDADHVGPFPLQHLAVIGVAPRDPEFIGEPAGGLVRNVSAGDQLGPWVSQVGPGVAVRHPAATDDGRPERGMRRHSLIPPAASPWTKRLLVKAKRMTSGIVPIT